MKKIWIVVCAVLAFVLIGCNNTPENEEIETRAVETVSLKTACQEHSGIVDLDGVYAEIAIHTEQIYRFTNRNEEFIAAFEAFWENEAVSKGQNVEPNGKHIHISFPDPEIGSFIIYENDVIKIFNDSGASSWLYFSDGIYKAFDEELGPYLEESGIYCPLVENGAISEYAVYDKNLVALESDSIINDVPHIYYNDGIVHLWVQWGTGILTRGAKFFDVETGKVSPVYSGQTDYYGNSVCAALHSRVAVYDMFSGKEIYCFDTFEKPLGDCMENVASAYFSKDGTQIIVEYLNTDYERETQIFDMP